jgi:hypothetical protein
VRRYLPGDRTYLCVRCIGRRYGSPGRRHARGQERILVGHPSLTVTVQSHPNVDAVNCGHPRGCPAWAVTLATCPFRFLGDTSPEPITRAQPTSCALRAAAPECYGNGRDGSVRRAEVLSTCRFDRRSQPTNSN